MTGGIVVVGANGSGKTTLGRRLAEALHIAHIDIEDVYFKPSPVPYARPRTREEARALLTEKISTCDAFVFSAVNGDFGEALNVRYACVVYLHAPNEVRLTRVKQRAIERFGDRILPGGDMYEQEQAFFEFVATRTMDATDAWLKTLSCPIIDMDGARPIDETVSLIVQRLAAMRLTFAPSDVMIDPYPPIKRRPNGDSR